MSFSTPCHTDSMPSGKGGCRECRSRIPPTIGDETMLIEVVAVGIVLIIIGGGAILVQRGLQRPPATNAEYELAVDAYRQATAELESVRVDLEKEMELFRDLNREMSSSLILSSGCSTHLQPDEEHDLHVEADLRRRRQELA
jgi:hypothetical protein